MSAGVAATLLAGCTAGLVTGGLGLFKWYGLGHVGPLLQLAGVSALLVGGHVATCWWAWSTRGRLHPMALIVTQVPFAATYIAYLPWYHYRFSPWYLAWLYAGLAVLAGLLVWYLQDFRNARRAIAFLCTAAVFVAANLGAGFVVGWRHTNGFGLVGEPTPWAALDGLAADSCLSTNAFHTSGTRLVQAHCPSGPHADFYSDHHDTTGFDHLLCGDQPRAAFVRWWDRQSRYQVAITLNFGYTSDWHTVVDSKTITPPLPAKQGGSTATITLPVQVLSETQFGTDRYPMGVDKPTETWTVQLRTTTLGGWKVCHIDVPSPIHDHPQ